MTSSVRNMQLFENAPVLGAQECVFFARAPHAEEKNVRGRRRRKRRKLGDFASNLTRKLKEFDL